MSNITIASALNISGPTLIRSTFSVSGTSSFYNDLNAPIVSSTKIIPPTTSNALAVESNLRYNSSTKSLELYNGTAWVGISSGSSGSAAGGENTAIDVGGEINGDIITINKMIPPMDALATSTEANLRYTSSTTKLLQIYNGIGWVDIGSGNVIAGGNTGLGTLVLGTNDEQTLELETSGITKLYIGTTGNISGVANINISGLANLESNLLVKQATTLLSSLTLTGVQTNMSSLNISGSTILESTLMTKNNVSFNSDLNISGTTFINNLIVSGTSFFNDTITSQSRLNVSGNTNINGATTLGSSLNISGSTILESNLLVAQPITASSSLTISGVQTNMSSLNISGSTILESNLLVAQPITASSSLTISGVQTNMSSLNISGSTILESTLITKNNVSFNSDLNISGTTYINNLIVSGTSNIGSNSTVFSTISVTGASTFQDVITGLSRLNISGNTIINGVATLGSSINISGIVILESNLLVKQPMTTSSNLTVVGAQTNISSLNISGTTFLLGSVSMGTRLNIGLTSNISTLNVRNNLNEIADFRSNDNEAFITIGNYGNVNKAGYISYVSSASQIRVGHRGITDILYINTSGNTNFGIQTSNPSNGALEVRGPGTIAWGDPNGFLKVGAGSTAGFLENMSAQTRLWIPQSTNRIGINNTSPAYVIHATDTTRGIIRLNTTTAGTVGSPTYDGIQLFSTTSSGEFGLYSEGNNTNDRVYIRNGADSGIGINTSGVVIDSSNNVGIKRNSPSYALDVNGTINCDRILRSTGLYPQEVSYYKSTNQSIANNTVVAVSFDTQDSGLTNDATFLSVGGGNTTFTNNSGSAQIWNVQATVEWDLNSTSYRYIRILKVGATGTDTRRVAVDSRLPQATFGTQQSLSSTVYLLNNEYIQIEALQATGGALNVVGDAQANAVNTRIIITRLS
jgi:helix-turn-helix protein